MLCLSFLEWKNQYFLSRPKFQWKCGTAWSISIGEVIFGRVNCAVIRSGIKNAHRSGPYIVAGQST